MEPYKPPKEEPPQTPLQKKIDKILLFWSKWDLMFYFIGFFVVVLGIPFCDFQPHHGKDRASIPPFPNELKQSCFYDPSLCKRSGAAKIN